MARSQSDDLSCRFCGKTHAEVRKLIHGPGHVSICDECVGLCIMLFEDSQEQIPELAALDAMSVVAFLRTTLASRPLDSLTVGELRRTIAAQRDLRWPRPTAAATDGASEPVIYDMRNDAAVAAFLSKQYGVPTIALDGFEVSPEIIALLPADATRRHRVIPLNRVGASLVVAMEDPSNIFGFVRKIRWDF